MKIVHLNTYDGNGGAGRACLRLNKALNNNGVHSEVWVNYKFRNNPEIGGFNTDFFHKVLTAFGIVLERFTASAFTRRLKIPFSIPIWGRDISKHPALKNADIIHLHWINHAFLPPRQLARLQKLNKPLVWTFHDSNAFTGGCHVRYQCEHYLQECGNCPLLNISGENDFSHRIWKAKNRAYQQLDISVIAPSRWMQDSVKKSKLLGSRPVQIIPNTLDMDIFRPYNKALAKKGLGLASEKFILLSGFMPSRNDLHKGTPFLLKALEILAAEGKTDNFELVIFGNRSEKNMPDFPVKTTFLGAISNDERLALCYSAADVFLSPSLEDNLPYTVMESLSCGTPVVAFNTSGLPDLITHKHNGYLAEYRSSSDLAAGIEYIFKHPERKILNENCRDSSIKRFAEGVIAAKHFEFYHQVLNKTGINKSSETARHPLLSVITVVYNNVKHIERTILSVLNQTYPYIEYIIIDGESTDGTVDSIKKYQNRIAKFVSEKDSGIYDAMNKGLALASGDYVLFMNSGDEIYAPDTVVRVFASAPDADIYYGETELIDENQQNLGRRKHKTPQNLTPKSFRYGMSVGHQAIYVRRSLAPPYNMKYQLSSDIDWILTILEKADKIVNTHLYTAKFLIGGMSKKRHRKSLWERYQIFKKHYGFFPNLLNHAVIAGRLAAYYFGFRR